MPNDPSILASADAIASVGEVPPRVASSEVVFEVMVATMWSVGELIAAEVERSRAAVTAMGLHPRRGGSAFGAIAAGALPFSEIEFDRLTRSEARLAYAAAEWLAATSLPADRRSQFLRGLRLRLRLTDTETAQLIALAHEADTAPPREAFAHLLAAI